METLAQDLLKIVQEWAERDVVLNSDGIYDSNARREATRYRMITERISAEEAREYVKKNTVPYTLEEIEQELPAIIKAIRIIPFLVNKTSRKSFVGSYGLKHVVERCIFVKGRGSYLSNGEAILAMLYLGYKAKLSKEGSLNCTFNCSYAKNDHDSGHGTVGWLRF